MKILNWQKESKQDYKDSQRGKLLMMYLEHVWDTDNAIYIAPGFWETPKITAISLLSSMVNGHWLVLFWLLLILLLVSPHQFSNHCKLNSIEVHCGYICHYLTLTLSARVISSFRYIIAVCHTVPSNHNVQLRYPQF